MLTLLRSRWLRCGAAGAPGWPASQAASSAVCCRGGGGDKGALGGEQAGLDEGAHGWAAGRLRAGEEGGPGRFGVAPGAFGEASGQRRGRGGAGFGCQGGQAGGGNGGQVVVGDVGAGAGEAVITAKGAVVGDAEVAGVGVAEVVPAAVAVDDLEVQVECF